MVRQIQKVNIGTSPAKALVQRVNYIDIRKQAPVCPSAPCC